MVERAHLAALDFKSKSQLNQAKIKQGVEDHKFMDFKTCFRTKRKHILT